MPTCSVGRDSEKIVRESKVGRAGTLVGSSSTDPTVPGQLSQKVRVRENQAGRWAGVWAGEQHISVKSTMVCQKARWAGECWVERRAGVLEGGTTASRSQPSKTSGGLPAGCWHGPKTKPTYSPLRDTSHRQPARSFRIVNYQLAAQFNSAEKENERERGRERALEIGNYRAAERKSNVQGDQVGTR